MSLALLQQMRSRRIERLLTELQRAKVKVRQAEESLDKAKKEYSEYHLWRGNEEKSMFNALLEGHFPANKMHGYNASLEMLRIREVELKDKIPDRENKVKQSIQYREATQLKLQEATKKKEKIDEFLKEEEKEKKLAEELAEEEVIDELSCFKQSSK
ncbi:MAG: YscO family type III secretion system apparatus protein [Thiotrichaceae bacterium]|nr:YscO family type III secretion system apparatus protein [Thiotrichaceae bacterium]